MAIIVEEENKFDIIRFVTWFVILVIIISAAYYIFFAKPELVEIAAPTNFQALDPLAKITLNPDDVINSKNFQSLKQYVNPPQPANFGRANPFLAP